MNNHPSSRITMLLLIVCGLLNHSVTAAAEKPNIIYILADDLGYGDLGCYGQKQIKTPNIDQLAADGIRFTQHYSGSTVCAPSRCCLLTGMHTGHARIRGNQPSLLTPGDVTVAALLKSAGYGTACIGKWGVGDPPPPGDPNKNGFDYFYGYLDMFHAHNYYPDYLWKNSSKVPVKGNVVEAIKRGGVAIKRSQYSHDLFESEALSYIESRAENKNPFFLYLPFTIPHANNEAGNEGMEVPNDSPYTLEQWPQAHKNHAAMISRLDITVGKIVALLKSLKIDEQTLVIFTSDNGPHREGGADPKFFQSSGELRGFKRDLHEGGIRVPLIARWGSQIKAGSTSDHVSAFWDFLPTACELAGVKIPETSDGISYVPALVGETAKQRKHDALYWEFHERGSVQAVRMGNWKLIRHFQGAAELYDLFADKSEQEDIASRHPDIVKKLEAVMDASRTNAEMFPLKSQPAPKKKSPSAKK